MATPRPTVATLARGLGLAVAAVAFLPPFLLAGLLLLVAPLPQLAIHAR